MNTLRRQSRAPRVRNLLAFSGFIMLLFGMLVLYQAFREYDQAIERGRKDAERLATILADQIKLTFITVDLSLQRAVERQYLNLLFGGHLPKDMVHNLNLWVEEIPQLVAMMVVGDSGEVEMAVHDKKFDGWLDYRRNMRNSLPYATLEQDNALGLYIGPYAENKNLNSNLILTARRINKLNGTFGGIVLAAVQSSYFLDFFNSIDSGANRYLSLTLKDGTDLLAGVNHPRANTLLSQQYLMDYRKEMASKETVSELRKVSGSLKIIAMRDIADLPLTLSVIVDEDDFLRAFWQDRFKDLSFLAIFTVFGSVLSFFALTMAKQIIRVEESEAAAILASQAKSEFLANMSHELRTPLNAIIGFSEMMNSGYFGPMNAKQKERMQDINLCGNHLLHLITDILEFSKGEAGKLEIVEEKVDMAAIIEETIRMMSEKVKSKGCNLRLEVSPNLPKLFADKRKLKQILINLISNAVKFTPPKGDVTVGAKREANGSLALWVMDTGIGIAEEDIPTALSVFGQVHRSHSHEGTGLGLPLCRMFAELHGGKLTLTSTVGEGTTVRVMFPAARVISPDE
ncbi:MAG: sensor histidine kinase [Rickettsiales bacterium]|nr:sensor histidine kinase [Rickettsiales bacterium]